MKNTYSIFRRKFLPLCILFCGAPLVGCDDDATCPRDFVATEPILQMTVLDGRSGTSVANYTLSDFNFNGNGISAGVVRPDIKGTTAIVDGGLLRCSGTCTFGGVELEGGITMTITAPSFAPKVVTLSPKWTKREDKKCVVEFSGPTMVTIVL